VFGRHLAVPGTFDPVRTSLLDGDGRVTKFVLGIQNTLKKTGHKPGGFNQYPLECKDMISNLEV